MKFISLVTVLLVLTSCASSPTPKSCSANWDLLDKGTNNTRRAQEARNALHPNEKTYLDQDCQKLSSENGKTIFDLVNLISEYDFDSWTQEAKENKANLEDEDKEWVENFKRNQKNLESLPIPYTVSESREMLEDLLLKQEAFKKLKANFKLLSREARYLIPISYKKTKDWLALETSEKDQQEIKKLTQRIQSKEKASKDKAAYQKGYMEEMNKFLSSEFNNYDLTKDEFNLDVIQSDGIDNYGLTLGQTIFKFSRSKVFDIENFKKSGNSFEINLLNKTNSERISFNFILNRPNKVALLLNAKVDNTILTNTKAISVLGMASN